MNQVRSPQERLAAQLASLVESSRPKLAREAIAELSESMLGDGTHALRDSATQLCRSSPQMLGPLYEALVVREHRYVQGQYFTPQWLADRLTEHVVRHQPTSVLDPAVGAGALLSSVASAWDAELVGLDLDPVCIAMARAGLEARGVKAVLDQRDFLEPAERPRKFDAVICNPPYVRHHALPGETKTALAARYEREFGLRPSGLSSSYVYFFLEAARRLNDEGILVFVTPAEFLDVRYGRVVKELLNERMTLETVERFTPDELAFDGVLTTTAITVARRASARTNHVVRFAEATREGAEKTRLVEADTLAPALNWGLEFPSTHQRHAKLIERRPRKLRDYVRVRRGIATGANGFFLMTDQQARERRLASHHLCPVIASARDLPGETLGVEEWERLRALGRRVWLLDVRRPVETLEDEVLTYLEAGIVEAVHERYNCRTRTPWYRVEDVPPPDIIVTYMNRSATRFVRNKTDARVMSVFLNMYVEEGVDISKLLSALRSDETQELIELAGRTYGGGLRKVEPGTLLDLPMPEL